MARIGLAGFLHETNTFATSRATWQDFVLADAWPGLCEGEAVLAQTAGMNLAVAGFAEAASAHTLVPLVWCSANPSGPVTTDAFERYWALLKRHLEAAGPLDALFLDLHGAMVTEAHEDGEGELLRRLRALLGPALPIICALDFHANISSAMVAATQLLVVYRTYPHVDMAETGTRVAASLDRLLAGERLHAAWRQLGFQIPLPWQCSELPPMRELLAECARLEADSHCLANLAPGFPLADVTDGGPTLLLYGRDAGVTEAAADRLCARIAAAGPDFSGTLWSPRAAVLEARRQAGPGGPIVLADTQDNPGGGGDGDATELIHELLAQDAASACVGLVCDPEAAGLARALGVGAQMDPALGARAFRSERGPVPGPFLIEALGTGHFVGTGPFYRGCRMDLGPMALLRKNGVRILVASRKQQAADQAMFRHLGVEPATEQILVLKSSVHFRADFAGLARAILIVEAPGANTADPARLEYRRLRPGMVVYRDGKALKLS